MPIVDGEQRLLEFIAADIVGDARIEVDRDTSLLETGLIDSMGLFRLMTFLEETYAVRIPEEDIIADNFQSIKSILAYVENLVSKQGSR